MTNARPRVPPNNVCWPSIPKYWLNCWAFGCGLWITVTALPKIALPSRVVTGRVRLSKVSWPSTPTFLGSRISGRSRGLGRFGDRTFMVRRIWNNALMVRCAGQDDYTLSRTTLMSVNTKGRPHRRFKDPASILTVVSKVVSFCAWFPPSTVHALCVFPPLDPGPHLDRWISSGVFVTVQKCSSWFRQHPRGNTATSCLV